MGLPPYFGIQAHFLLSLKRPNNAHLIISQTGGATRVSTPVSGRQVETACKRVGDPAPYRQLYGKRGWTDYVAAASCHQRPRKALDRPALLHCGRKLYGKCRSPGSKRQSVGNSVTDVCFFSRTSSVQSELVQSFSRTSRTTERRLSYPTSLSCPKWLHSALLFWGFRWTAFLRRVQNDYIEPANI